MTTVIAGIASANLKKAYPAKINFLIHWLIVQLVIKNYENDLNDWKAFKMNTMKDYHGLPLMC